MSKIFENKSVMVTGAGIGIGYALCEAFAREGAHVALNDIDEDLAIASAEKINAQLGTKNVSPYAFDVADCALLEKNIHSFSGQNTGIDIMIANAGITYYTPFLSSTIEAFDRLVAVNLRGSYFSAQYAAKEMIKHKKAGRIILMSSINGHRVIINLSIYGATKAGIRMMAKNLGLELGPHNITVNAISPGATRTERTVKDDPEFDKNWSGVTPTGNKIMVEDVVAAAFYLASPEAKQFTGQTMLVDGGWTLQSPLPQAHPRVPDFSSKLK